MERIAVALRARCVVCHTARCGTIVCPSVTSMIGRADAGQTGSRPWKRAPLATHYRDSKLAEALLCLAAMTLENQCPAQLFERSEMRNRFV